MVAELVDYVVGVDTHRDEHTLALIEVASGALLAETRVPSNGRGYAQALRLARQRADGPRVWAIEGAGHYGAGLARYLSKQGETVLEVGRSPRGAALAAGCPPQRGRRPPRGARAAAQRAGDCPRAPPRRAGRPAARPVA
jgi:transposase